MRRGSESNRRAPTYMASASYSTRTSVDSDAAPPSSGSIWRNAVTGVATAQAGSSSRPSSDTPASTRTAVTVGGTNPPDDDGPGGRAAIWSNKNGISMETSRQTSGRRPPAPRPFGRRVEVLGHKARRVGYALVTRGRPDIDDVGLPVALDDVHAVQLRAERAATPQRDIAQLVGNRERLALFFLGSASREHLLDSEAPIADHVQLPIAASLRLVIALREDGITPRASEVEVREVGAAPDDSDVVAARALIRLDHDRPVLQQGKQSVGAGRDVRGRHRHAGGLEGSSGDDLVAQCSRGWVGVDDCGAQPVKRPGEAEGEPADLVEDVQVVLDTDAGQLHRPTGGRGHDDIYRRSQLRERPNDTRHLTGAVLGIRGKQHAGPRSPHTRSDISRKASSTMKSASSVAMRSDAIASVMCAPHASLEA